MAIIKCKMCGGDLVLIEGQSVAECDSCGRLQTVPAADNEKKLTLFSRANRLRAACEFDKAAGIYESIVADFPEEAEAYWGLVLCKYGIEYVDDPGTGKKVPTCHRSSFDSVMDDGNYEQALENTDAVARKVYREEARVIEGIRKRIIEVSSKEEPYDIFICYKETDAKGDRTIDSVLAQDIYDALTARDYRVFFARITLVEDALGKEYEPFIFAALNSAPIMLALGTDYEHFHAVWVKNEWSRFLQMKEAGMNKTLIPCFKNMDPYDLPKEFQALQAQDMGKVGFLQELIHGIEKILPKKKVQTVAEVQRGVSPNVNSLLKRGNMFLEDKDWQNADKYFDDVLDIDPECAEAYLGKTLVQHKCLKPEGLVTARLMASINATRQNLSARERDEARELEIAQRWALYKYVRLDDIRKFFNLNTGYTSSLASRKQQLEAEKLWFQQDKYMSRAMRYASGQFKQQLLSIQKQIFDSMEQRIQDAQQADEAAIKRICDTYEEMLRTGDIEGEKLRAAAEERREQDYQHYRVRAEKAIEDKDRDALLKVKHQFEDLLEYKDSPVMVTILQEKIDAIDAVKEAERQRIAAQKQYAKEIAEAYEKELPLVKERPQVEEELNQIKAKVQELSGKLEKRGALVACLVFFVLGVLEFIIGLDGEEFLLWIGGFCSIACGAAAIVTVKSRGKMRKELQENRAKIPVLQEKLDKINNCMSLKEFTRVYELRQSEEGRAQLAAEEKARKQKELKERQEAEKARKKRTTKMITTTAVILVLIAVIAVSVWYVSCHLIPGNKVKKAEAFIAEGNYQEAYNTIYDVSYGNSEELLEEIALHGKYVVTTVKKDDDDYDDDDYFYALTYNEHGLPREFYIERIDEQSEMTAGLLPEYELEYTWYESGNLESCSIYENSKEIFKLRTHITFYDIPEATVAYLPGSGQTEDYRWNTINYYGLVGFGVKHRVNFDTDDGTVNFETGYHENGLTTDYTYETDAQGRLYRYYDPESAGEYILTYNKKGELATRLDVDDRGDPDSIWNDEWIYSRNYVGGNLVEWTQYPESTKNEADAKEVYTYDDFGNAVTIAQYAEEKILSDYRLDETYKYYLTYEWLDFSEMEEQLAAYYVDAAYKAQLRDLRAAMGTSISDAYALAQELEGVENAKELVDICKTYYPYCGTFDITEFEGVSIESDFCWDGENVYWVCKQGDGILLAELDGELHTYFQEPVCVQEMKALEEFEGTDAFVCFENGEIAYTWGYYEYMNTDSNDNITSREGFVESWKLTMVPQK